MSDSNLDADAADVNNFQPDDIVFMRHVWYRDALRKIWWPAKINQVKYDDKLDQEFFYISPIMMTTKQKRAPKDSIRPLQCSDAHEFIRVATMHPKYGSKFQQAYDTAKTQESSLIKPCMPNLHTHKPRILEELREQLSKQQSTVVNALFKTDDKMIPTQHTNAEDNLTDSGSDDLSEEELLRPEFKVGMYVWVRTKVDKKYNYSIAELDVEQKRSMKRQYYWIPAKIDKIYKNNTISVKLWGYRKAYKVSTNKQNDCVAFWRDPRSTKWRCQQLPKANIDQLLKPGDSYYKKRAKNYWKDCHEESSSNSDDNNDDHQSSDDHQSNDGENILHAASQQIVSSEEESSPELSSQSQKLFENYQLTDEDHRILSIRKKFEERTASLLASKKFNQHMEKIRSGKLKTGLINKYNQSNSKQREEMIQNVSLGPAIAQHEKIIEAVTSLHSCTQFILAVLIQEAVYFLVQHIENCSRREAIKVVKGNYALSYEHSQYETSSLLLAKETRNEVTAAEIDDSNDYEKSDF